MELEIAEIPGWTHETLKTDVPNAFRVTVRHMRRGKTVRKQQNAPYPPTEADSARLCMWAAGLEPGDILRVSWITGSGDYMTGASAKAKGGLPEAPDPTPAPGAPQARATPPRSYAGLGLGPEEPPEPITTRAARLGSAAEAGVEAGVNAQIVLMSALVQDSNACLVRALDSAHEGPNRALETVNTAQLQNAAHVEALDKRLMVVIEKQSESICTLVTMREAPPAAPSADTALWERLFKLNAEKSEAERDAAILANAEDESPLKHAGEAIELIDKLANLKNGRGAPPEAVWDGVLGNLARGNGTEELARAAAKMSPEGRAALAAQLGSILSQAGG
jgi:hypothetical protein